MMDVPSYWKTDLAYIEKAAAEAKRAQVRRLCMSAGGRPVIAFSYGEKQEIIPAANYSSACGAHEVRCYNPVDVKKPVVILLGAVHGGETEGTAAVMNLISLMETGVDLNGDRYDSLVKAAEKVRLVLIPLCNPDGRARVVPDGMIGCTGDELRYWMQGTWKDGSLCRWPDCKKVHPIKEHVDFLGGYFNDDGINIMHDNFFKPMAKETQALMDICDEEHADWIIHLHGGSNSMNDFLQTNYVTLECQQAIQNLAKRCDEYCKANYDDIWFAVRRIPEKECGENPPSFNLTSAMHHICGGVSAVFESNECLIDEPGPKLNHEQVYRSHRIMFEQLFLTAVGE